MTGKPKDLYDVAKAVTHSIGAAWTDPRTLKTHPPPKRRKAKRKAKRKPQ